jgi:uncharacterized Tic20 family protein
MSSYGPPPGHPSSQPGPGGVSSDDRTWALASHIGALVTAWFAFGFLAPLLVMLVKTDSPFVRRHATESLNFQISMLIYSIVGAIAAFLVVILTFGIGALIVIPLVVVVLLVILLLVIQATVKASRGEDYRYPLTIRFFN